MPLSPVILQKGGILPAPLRSRNLLALVLGTVCVEPRVRSQLVGHQFSRTPSALRGSGSCPSQVRLWLGLGPVTCVCPWRQVWQTTWPPRLLPGVGAGQGSSGTCVTADLLEPGCHGPHSHGNKPRRGFGEDRHLPSQTGFISADRRSSGPRDAASALAEAVHDSVSYVRGSPVCFDALKSHFRLFVGVDVPGERVTSPP